MSMNFKSAGQITDEVTGDVYLVVQKGNCRAIEFGDGNNRKYIRHPEEWPLGYGQMALRNGIVVRREITRPAKSKLLVEPEQKQLPGPDTHE